MLKLKKKTNLVLRYLKQTILLRLEKKKVSSIWSERMLHNPYKIVKMFEEEVAHYTGAPFAVSTNSCTNALLLCCKYEKVQTVTIPSRTYLSVPQSIIHAGGQVRFEDVEWEGIYKLEPYRIYDAAKRLTSGMYIPNTHHLGYFERHSRR